MQNVQMQPPQKKEKSELTKKVLKLFRDEGTTAKEGLATLQEVHQEITKTIDGTKI